MLTEGPSRRGPSPARFPPDTEEKQKYLGAFFGKNPPPGVAEKVPAYVKAAQEKNPQIKEWAIMGVRTLPVPPPPSSGNAR